MKFSIQNIATATTLLTFSAWNVHGYAENGGVAICSDIVPKMGAASFEVCALGYFESARPVLVNKNGTHVYQGDYFVSFDIVEGLKQGQEPTWALPSGGTSMANESTGITISVDRKSVNRKNKCTVSITLTPGGTAMKCKKCNYCGKNMYRADCSNIENGRRMGRCETAIDYLEGDQQASGIQDVVFFPLTANALPSFKTMAPVGAPSMTPMKAPKTKAGIKTPVTSPIVKM